MTSRYLRLTAVAVCLLSLAACSVEESAEKSKEPADLILSGGVVHTMDSTVPRGEAVAIQGGRILAVGSTVDILARYEGPVRDLAGAMVLPGFHDAHVHPIGAGIDLLRCDLSEARSVEETLAAVAECDKASPGDDWLLGAGWSLGLFEDANPHKSLIDGIVPNRPVLLQGADGHSSWANSVALAEAGVEAETVAPPLGVIERDPDGTPSGTVRETAQYLLWNAAPEPTEADREAGLLAAVAVLNSVGVTSAIGAAVDTRGLALYQRLADEGRLNLRFVASMGGYGEEGDTLADPASRGTGARVRSDAVKIFADGVLEGETAALLEPYLETEGGHMGMLNVAPDVLNARVVDMDRRGIQVHVHAIGDAAVREALDAFQAAREANGVTDNRHHIAHLQLIHPDDYARFAELGVAADFQSVWAFPDEYIVDINTAQVGQARVDRMYPIGSLERAGATIVTGSDWNVSTPNPLVAIEVAMTRQDPEGRRTGVLNADEAVSLDTMLRAYTVNGAWLMHQENETGRLAAGMKADLVVLEKDLFEVAPADIGEVGILATYLEGELVYDAASTSADAAAP
ncbi:MAG: amidohydrolase [Pseudomonadales bacterium]